jgi:polyhydroxyalkanoate synthase subunit PhaC
MADPLGLPRRTVATVRNGVDYLRGTDLADLRPTPTDTVWSSGKVRLLRVRSDRVSAPAPLLIVHSLISKPYIFDLLPGNSVLEWLRDHGHDVYLLEWGETDETDVANDLATYVDDFVRPAIGVVRKVSEADEVALLGYCFGGLLSLLALATDPGLPVRDLGLVATPVDFHAIPALRRAMAHGLEARHMTDSTGNMPPNLFRWAFRTLRPTNDVAALVTLVDRLHDREYARNHHALSRWTDDQIPFPGALAEEMMPVARDSGFLDGTVRVGSRPADFANVRVRALAFMALRDHLVPHASATPIERLLPNSDVERFEIDSGHVALLVGARAQGKTLPALHDWLTSNAHRSRKESGNGRATATHP